MHHEYMILVWACYASGLALHVLMAAADTVQEGFSVKTYKQYFRKYAIAIAGRMFVLLCLFPFLWDNPSAFDIEGLMHTKGLKIAFSGIIGYFCEGFADRGLKLLGITQKLPALPGETAAAPPGKP